MIVAVLDIGSNTSLLLIARLSKDNPENHEIWEDQLFFTRLAEGFSKTKISRQNRNKESSLPSAPLIQKEALERQRFFFEKARKLVNQYSVECIKCVATAAARTAQNVEELLTMGDQYGFSVKIISAREEARLSRKGALFQLPVDPMSAVVIDIGGASTEISTARQYFSLPIGSVNLTEEFMCKDPPSEENKVLLMKNIQKELEQIPFSFSKKSLLVATAGTPTTLAALKNKTDQTGNLHGELVPLGQVNYWWEYLCQLPFEKRKNLKGMPFYRADVLPAGLSVLKQSMEKFHWNECVVSTMGLRYGLLCQF